MATYYTDGHGNLLGDPANCYTDDSTGIYSIKVDTTTDSTTWTGDYVVGTFPKEDCQEDIFKPGAGGYLVPEDISIQILNALAERREPTEDSMDLYEVYIVDRGTNEVLVYYGGEDAIRAKDVARAEQKALLEYGANPDDLDAFHVHASNITSWEPVEYD